MSVRVSEAVEGSAVDDHVAEVIPLRPAPRTPSCLICVKSAIGAVTFCSVFDELIVDETAAAVDCPAYIEDPDAR